MNTTALIKFLIFWAPTIIFALMLILGFLMGILRGFRRSRTFLIHRVIAASIALTLFFVATYSVAFDRALLSIIESFGVNLHDELNVASSIDTLKGVLAGAIPSLLEETDTALAIALSENSTYILALVNVIYNFVFAIISMIIYYLIKWFLFLCYLLFYPEWKYRQKYKHKVEIGKKAKPYKTHRLAGGLIGLCSSLIVALVSFSFVGNILYIAAGTGEKGIGEHNFSDKETAEIYQVINSVESYGSKGIFKVLNLAKDKNGVPLYLYPAGYLSSSKIEDPSTGEKDRVYFTFEMGNYTNFLKDTASLALEYCGDEIEDTISGNEVELATVVKDLLANNSFKLKFRELLVSYTDKSTFINEFIFDVIDSYCANIDKSSLAESLSEDAAQILQIMFVEGYKSPVIYYEASYDSLDNLPYIKPSDLISKKDLLVVYDIFTDLIDKGLLDDDYDLEDTNNVIDLLVTATSHLEEFKIFNSNNPNRKNIDGVLGRLFSYAEIKLLDLGSEANGNYLENTERISWTQEILDLVDNVKDIKTFYNKISELTEDNASTSECFSAIFDDQEVVNAYDNVVDYLSSSKLIGKVMGSKYVFGFIEDLIETEDRQFDRPRDLSFTNVYNSNGEVESYGELYNFLMGLKRLATDTHTRELLVNLIDSNEDVDILTLVRDAETDLVRVENGKSTIDYFKDSGLLRAVISSFLIEMSGGDSPINIPSVAKELDSNGLLPIAVIKKEEFDLFIDAFFTPGDATNPNNYGLIKLLPDNLDFEDEDSLSSIFSENGNLFENTVIRNLIYNSSIFQATFGNVIIDNQDSFGDSFKLPAQLQEPSNWLAEFEYDNTGNKVTVKESETVKMFEAMFEFMEDTSELDDFDNLFDDLVKDSLTKLNYDATKVTSITVDSEGEKTGVKGREVVFNSLIVRAILSTFMEEELPRDLRNNGIEAAKDSDGYITAEEFYALFELVEFLDITDLTNSNAFDELETKYIKNVGLIIEETTYPNNPRKAKLIDLVYNSSPVKCFFTEILEEEITNNSMLQDHPDAKYTEGTGDNTYNVYKKDEIEKLIGFVGDKSFEDNADNKFDASHINIEDVKNNFFETNTETNEIECSSKLLLSSISINIVKNAAVTTGELIVPNNALLDYNDYTIIKDAELYELLSFAKDLGITNVDSFNSVMENDANLTLSKIEPYIQEDRENVDIIRATISDKVISSNALTIPTYALDTNYEDCSVVKAKELSYLFAIVIGNLEIDSIESMDDDTQGVKAKLDAVKLNEIEGWMKDSEVVHATVSDKVLKNAEYLVIPKVASVYIERFGRYEKTDIVTTFTSAKDYTVNNDIISLDELTRLFDALESIGIEIVGDAYGVTENEFDPANYDDEQIKAIAESSILRATVTKNVGFTTGDTTVVAKAFTHEVDFGDEYVQVNTNSQPNKIAILHQDEVIHFLQALRVFKNENDSNTAFTSHFDLPHLKQLATTTVENDSDEINTELDIVLNSDIFNVAISDFLATIVPLPREDELLYCFEHETVETYGVSSDDVIKASIASLPSV